MKILHDTDYLNAVSIPVFENGTGVLLGVVGGKDLQLSQRFFSVIIPEVNPETYIETSSNCVTATAQTCIEFSVSDFYIGGGGKGRHLFCDMDKWRLFSEQYRMAKINKEIRLEYLEKEEHRRLR